MLRKDILTSDKAQASTADNAEIERFNALAEEWWKPNGKFKVVHAFNATRVGWLSTHVPAAFDRAAMTTATRPLEGLRLVDVGCGAGIVTEPMARLGAQVLGIDAAERNVAIATHHLEGQRAQRARLDLQYQHARPEELNDAAASFDIALSLEVVEHVADVEAFLAACAALVKPGGVLVIGTLNRTLKSKLLAIHAAENVLGWLPKGTHDWNKFLSPDEIGEVLARHGFKREALTGVAFNPMTWRWSIVRDASVNYMAMFRKAP